MTQIQQRGAGGTPRTRFSNFFRVPVLPIGPNAWLAGSYSFHLSGFCKVRLPVGLAQNFLRLTSHAGPTRMVLLPQGAVAGRIEVADMQKVRVSLVDADGVTHEVVGWRRPGQGGVVFMAVDEPHGGNISPALSWLRDGVTVTPIVELPTGLGAVVEVQYPGMPVCNTERFVRLSDWWLSQEPDVSKPQFVSDGWIGQYEFTVLSEGVK